MLLRSAWDGDSDGADGLATSIWQFLTLRALSGGFVPDANALTSVHFRLKKPRGLHDGKWFTN